MSEVERLTAVVVHGARHSSFGAVRRFAVFHVKHRRHLFSGKYPVGKCGSVPSHRFRAYGACHVMGMLIVNTVSLTRERTAAAPAICHDASAHRKRWAACFSVLEEVSS